MKTEVINGSEMVLSKSPGVEHPQQRNGGGGDIALIANNEKFERLKNIQRNTFTRWVNGKLREGQTGLVIEDLDELSDGLKLIRLCEALSGKTVKHSTKEPKLRSQKLENVSVALNFLQNSEAIKIVNIDSAHIVDKNIKLIMGLIWMLVIHYNLGKLTEKENKNTSANNEKLTLKQRLLQWIRERLPQGVDIKNFTTDWNDGRVLGALVEACLPPDVSFDEWRQWNDGASDPEKALENTTEAIRAAEDGLGIAGLILPEELSNKNVDEQSVMTYLSQFLNLPLYPAKRNVGRIIPITDKEGAMTDEPFEFGIELESPEFLPDVDIFPRGDDSEIPMISVEKGEEPNSFHCSVVPKVPGWVTITVNAVKASSRVVFRVEETLVNVKKKIKGATPVQPTAPVIPVKLPKVSFPSNPVVNQKQIIVLDDVFVEPNRIKVLLESPDVSSVEASEELEPVPLLFDENLNVEKTQNVLTYNFTPKIPGSYKLFILLDGKPLDDGNGGLHTIEVQEDIPNKLATPKSNLYFRAIGPGLKEGIEGKPCVLFVDTKGQSEILNVDITGPGKTEIHYQNNRENDPSTAIIEYTPILPGDYIINITDTKGCVEGSPFNVSIYPEESIQSSDNLPLEAFLKGISEGEPIFVGEEVLFGIQPRESENGIASLEIEVYDPLLNAIDCNIVRDETSKIYQGLFVPKVPGKHLISVVADKVAVVGWPYIINAVEMPQEEPLTISKRGIYAVGNGLLEGSTDAINQFKIVSMEPLHDGNLKVVITGESKQKPESNFLQQSDDEYLVEYMVRDPGIYQIDVEFEKVPITGSPFKVLIKESRQQEKLGDSSSQKAEEPLIQMSRESQIDSIPNNTYEISNEEQKLHRSLDLNEECLTKSENGLKMSQNEGIILPDPDDPSSVLVEIPPSELGGPILVGVHSMDGVFADEVTTLYQGRGRFQISYKFADPAVEQIVIVVKKGENDVRGSPFIVEKNRSKSQKTLIT